MDRGEEGALEKMQDDPTVRAYLDLYDPIISILSPALPDTVPPCCHPPVLSHSRLSPRHESRTCRGHQALPATHQVRTAPDHERPGGYGRGPEGVYGEGGWRLARAYDDNTFPLPTILSRSPPTTPFLVPSLPLANPRRIVRTKTHRSHHSTQATPLHPARISLHLSSTVIVEPVLLHDAVPPTSTWIHHWHFPSAHFPPASYFSQPYTLESRPHPIITNLLPSSRIPVVYNRHRRSWVPLSVE